MRSGMISDYTSKEFGLLLFAIIFLVACAYGMARELIFYAKNGWNFDVEPPRKSGATGYIGTRNTLRLPVKLRIFVIQPLLFLALSAFIFVLCMFGPHYFTFRFGR